MRKLFGLARKRLLFMAAPTGSIDLKNCTLKFVDATTPTANSLDVHVDEGNIQWTRKRNIEAKKDRGILSYLKEGDQEPLEVNIECRFDVLKSNSGDAVTPFEFLEKTGNASSYTSTSPACEPYTIDIFVYNDNPCTGTTLDEIHQFSKFAFTEIGGDYKAGTLSVKGICNSLRPIATRTTLP